MKLEEKLAQAEKDIAQQRVVFENAQRVLEREHKELIRLVNVSDEIYGKIKNN
jgi:hypothetical protein